MWEAKDAYFNIRWCVRGSSIIFVILILVIFVGRISFSFLCFLSSKWFIRKNALMKTSLSQTHLGQSPFYCILYIRMVLAYDKFNNCMHLLQSGTSDFIIWNIFNLTWQKQLCKIFHDGSYQQMLTCCGKSIFCNIIDITFELNKEEKYKIHV